MIRIEKNATNQVVVTLRENSTVDDPIYLFELTNGTTLEKYYFISTDTSEFKDRYNRFQVIEKPNADTINGEVEVGLEGWYDYIVYQTSLEDLSGITSAEQALEYVVKAVEYGICWVEFGTRTTQVYEPEEGQTVTYQPAYDLLTEEGYYLLQEDGYKIELE